MRPQVIVHNTIGVDGAVTGFPVDMEVHYGALGNEGAEIHLIGAATVLAGLAQFGGGEIPETEADREPPATVENSRLPWWVIIDSGARLEGKLHSMRGFELCRDVVVLVSDATPPSYLAHLSARGYRHHVIGEQRVDLADAIALLASEYAAKRVLVDSGPSLVGALLDAGLVDRLSLLLAPHLVGREHAALFSQASHAATLSLDGLEVVGDSIVHLSYTVVDQSPDPRHLAANA